jgi:tRNA A37 methylthiotransferase MiaB
MKRQYTLEDFEKIVFKAKLKIPVITIATDLIVAYPTETEDEFFLVSINRQYHTWIPKKGNEHWEVVK